MRHAAFYIIFVLLFFYYEGFSQFQPTAVERSSQKIILSGKKYYLHKVKKGQTLYSICKVYNVSEDVVFTNNPELNSNIISEGQILKIPIFTEADPDSDQYHFHKVLKGETAYFISKKYNIPVDLIYEYNPGTKEGLKVEQILKIPKSSNIAYNTAFQDKNNQSVDNDLKTITGTTVVTTAKKKIIEPISHQATNRIIDNNELIEKGGYFYYEITGKDTLFVVAEKYGVTINDIIYNNENLRFGIRPGQIIKIPKISSFYFLAGDSLYIDSTIVYQFYSPEKCDSILDSQTKKSLRIALLMPFFATDIINYTLEKQFDTNEDHLITPGQKYFYNRSKNYIEFYLGVIMSLHSMKRSDVNIELFVYDTERDTNITKRLISKLKILEPELIIGPVERENLKLISDFSKEYKIPTVFPFMNNYDFLKDNPYLFQIAPSIDVELDNWSNYISRYLNKNIILVHNKDSMDFEKIKVFKEKLYNGLSSKPEFNKSLFHDIRYNDELRDSINKILNKNTENILIIASGDEGYISEAISFFNSLQKEYNIKILGSSALLSFENIQIRYYHNLELELFSPFFIDYENSITNEFIKNCRKILGYEPQGITSKGYNLVYLGYDVGLFFTNALLNYDQDICNCINYRKPKLLLTDYIFNKANYFGGFENTSINYIRYNKDFTFTKIQVDTISTGKENNEEAVLR